MIARRVRSPFSISRTWEGNAGDGSWVQEALLVEDFSSAPPSLPLLSSAATTFAMPDSSHESFYEAVSLTEHGAQPRQADVDMETGAHACPAYVFDHVVGVANACTHEPIFSDDTIADDCIASTFGLPLQDTLAEMRYPD